MCTGRSEVLGNETEKAVVGSYCSRAPKAAQLVVTVEGLLENELTVQHGEFGAHQLPPWFNEQALETLGDAKWELFCEELELVKRGYCCENYWLQQLPWVILGMVAIVPHSCFAGLCILVAGNRLEQKRFIDQHREWTDKFLKGALDKEILSKQSSCKPLSCTNWEQLFLKCGYSLATSIRTEAIYTAGQEENYFIDITFSPTRNASLE